MIFQEFHLLPYLNVYENIRLPLIYQKKNVDKSFLDKQLNMVGLKGYGNFRPDQLSGGQKQRVAIARAMANDPAIILADEPTGALDSKTGRMVMDLFHKLNREQGKTIILITHNRELAEETGRVLTMADGLLYGEGGSAHGLP
jgi:putative ABC transport system ATP-binding protein